MRKLNVFPIVVVVLLSSCSSRVAHSPECERYLKRLDETIEHRADFEKGKAARIASFWTEYYVSEDIDEKYDALKNIFDEYSRYDVDSALYCAHLKEQLAARSGNYDLISDAALDLADRYVVSGSYFGAQEQIKKLDTLRLSKSMWNKYCVTRYQIYHGLAKIERDSLRLIEHRNKERFYINLSRKYMHKEQVDEIALSTRENLDSARYDKARQVVFDRLHSCKVNDREKAALYYWLAKTYGAQGDKDKEIMNYAISSDYDKKAPVKASRSMVNLARLMYEAEEYDRAFNYLITAYNDAIQSDARVALTEINRLLPEVITKYDDMVARRNRALRDGLVASVVMILALCILVFYVYRERVKIHRMQDKIIKNNAEIKEQNAKILRRNVRLREANQIKVTYIGKYLSMFSEHIDSMERYRSQLRNVAKSQNLDDIQKALRSNEFIDVERDALYKEFDATFLGIFPDFVEQLNNLLQDDCHIGENLEPGTLSNELRIFALIKLGITESATIAKFLKKSPSTIYNYRVKLRNAAKDDRDDFEERLMKIGQVIQ